MDRQYHKWEDVTIVIQAKHVEVLFDVTTPPQPPTIFLESPAIAPTERTRTMNALNPIEQAQLAINQFLGGLIHEASSTSSQIALSLGMF